jgi:hypothetical protein
VEKDLIASQGDESNAHVQQVVLVLLVHEEVEDLVHQRNLHVSE